MEINQILLNNLTSEAAISTRLRMNYDMRNSADDRSQRMLNAIEPGTILPIHRHRATSETVIILRGAAVEIFYDDNGKEIERVYIKPNSDCVGLNIPIGSWHRIESLEPGTVIFEAKDGAYVPILEEDILQLD